MISLRTFALVALPLAVVGATAGAGPALAAGTSHGDGVVVRAAGSCTGTTDWKLKAKPDNAKVEVEFEVDSNKVGQTWTWALTDNGAAVAKGMSVTKAPSGSFSVARRITNKAGSDVIRFTAKHAGETCTGSVSV